MVRCNSVENIVYTMIYTLVLCDLILPSRSRTVQKSLNEEYHEYYMTFTPFNYTDINNTDIRYPSSIVLVVILLL